MTVPPLRKWRPCFGFYRDRRCGWQFFVHPNRDHNPIIVVSRWLRRWYLEIGRLEYRSESGWHIRPKYF